MESLYLGQARANLQLPQKLNMAHKLNKLEGFIMNEALAPM